jgi:hypothetical protein
MWPTINNGGPLNIHQSDRWSALNRQRPEKTDLNIDGGRGDDIKGKVSGYLSGPPTADPVDFQTKMNFMIETATSPL